MTSRPPARELCAATARRLGEPRFATASRVDLWLVLEVPGAWPDEVGDSLDPATPVGRALLPVLRAVPRARVLFIKSLAPAREAARTFYIAVTDESSARLYRFPLEGEAALLELDLFRVLAEDERYEPFRETRPLYLVCTHGTHDRCCAKFGFPLYRYLEQLAPGCVWQSSHVGGDRFAANVVCLPHGLYYGHVEPSDAEAIVQCSGSSRLHLPALRGRSCYPMPVQAAEHFLRQEVRETQIDAFRWVAHHDPRGITEVAFNAGDEQHRVRIERAPQEGLRFLTCDSCEEKRVTSYRFVDREVRPVARETRRAGALEYELQPAAMRDYGFIYRLRRETLTGYLEELELPAAERDPFFARFDVSRHRLILVGDTAVGAVSVVWRENHLHLANLHLLPSHQRRGLGTAIIRHLQAAAAAAGLPVTTQVLRVNPAQRLYERLGFRIAGEAGLRYRMIWQP